MFSSRYLGNKILGTHGRMFGQSENSKSAYTVLEGIVRGLLICLLNDGFTAFCILCINVE